MEILKKNKSRHVMLSDGDLGIMDFGYNDFKTLEGIKTPRVIDHFSVHFVLSGKGTLNLGGETYDIKAGEAFFLLPNTPLFYYPCDDEPWRYYWINFYGVKAEKLIKSFGVNLKSAVRKFAGVEEAEILFDEALKSNVPTEQAYYKAVSLLYYIAAAVAGGERNYEVGEGFDPEERVKQIIYLNYKNSDFFIDVIADVMHVSHSYVSKMFKQKTGMTVVKFLSEVRLKKAAELLSEKDYRIKELCAETGFNDELYFMKIFKKKYGMTVKEYREKMRKKRA